MDVPGRGHDNPLWLERPPFAPGQFDTAVIDRVAEHGARKLDLAASEWAGAFHPAVLVGRFPRVENACRPLRLPLGQPKI